MKSIFDIGAHSGEDTEFYLRKGFRVVAVEANPDLAEALRKRFASEISCGQLDIVEAAVAERDGVVEFFVNEHTVFGTIRETWARRNELLGARSYKIDVPAVTFDKILEKYGVPYYLKVDIEGADMLCVNALQKFSTRPDFVSIESNKTSWRELVSEFDVLERLGYRRFKIINQAKIQDQTEPEPVREGKATDYRFSEGNTGLFGNDLPDKWLSRRQSLLRYAVIFIKYRLFGDNTLGKKFALRLPWRIRRHLIPDWYDTHAAWG